MRRRDAFSHERRETVRAPLSTSLVRVIGPRVSGYDTTRVHQGCNPETHHHKRLYYGIRQTNAQNSVQGGHREAFDNTGVAGTGRAKEGTADR